MNINCKTLLFASAVGMIVYANSNNVIYAQEINNKPDRVKILNQSEDKTSEQKVNTDSYDYEQLTYEQREQIRQEAVEYGRNGDYVKSLALLEGLYKENPQNLLVVYDYMTILNWAGDYKKVIDIYEKSDYTDMPDYVRTNVAAAYNRLNLFDKAITVLQQGETENKETLIFLGQLYIKTDKMKQAYDLYSRLAEKYPLDVDIDMGKAEAARAISNSQMAAFSWKQALDLYDNNKEQKPSTVSREEIVDNLSIDYIRSGRYKDAGDLLQPYIDNKTANYSMIGNYMTVLNQIEKYKQSIKLFNEYFSEYDSAPTFVLRELAVSYIKDRQYNKVVEIYNYLLGRDTVNLEDRFNFAYYACLTGKNADLGTKQYAYILTSDKEHKYVTRVLNNAHELLTKGYLKQAGLIYHELADFDERYGIIYADDLKKAEQYQTALHEYYKIIQTTKNDNLRNKAWEGVAQTSVNIRDYKTAEDVVNKLKKIYESESNYSRAAGSFKNKQMGEYTLSVANYSDYDDSEQTDIEILANQYIDNGFWIEGEMGKSYVKDVEDNNSSVINTSRIGTRYIGRKWNSLVAMNLFGFDQEHSNGLYIDTLFRPTDRQSLNLIYNSAPIYDADALENDGGAIFGDNYILRYMYSLNQYEGYYIELRKSDYDDDNKRYGWEIGQNLNIYDDAQKGRSLDRTLHWGRDRYSNQDVVYNSPKISESIGGEWRWGKDLPNNDKIYNIFGINWERDYPDDLTLNPYYRVEYEKMIDKKRYVSMGFTYGLRTESWLGEGNWRYNNKQFDILYNLIW